jgi:hypothetical protein
MSRLEMQWCDGSPRSPKRATSPVCASTTMVNQLAGHLPPRRLPTGAGMCVARQLTRRLELIPG